MLAWIDGTAVDGLCAVFALEARLAFAGVAALVAGAVAVLARVRCAEVNLLIAVRAGPT